jgi:predicted Zn-dependent peptidase
MLYPSEHPYHHIVIGSMADIEAATLDDVERFFRTFYVPNNAVLTVVGDIDAAQTLELVKRWFGEIPPGGAVPPIPGNPMLDPKLGRTVRARVEAEVPLPRLIMAFRVPPYSSDDFAVAEVARAVLGSGRASRLYRRLVRERRIAKSVVSYVYPLLTGAGMLLTWVTGYPGAELDALEAALSEEIAGLAETDQTEVDRAIALSETDLVHELERVASRADLLSMFDLYFDDPGRLNHELDRLRGVTVEQIRAFAESMLGSDNRAVLGYVPRAAAKAAR